jgi:hypothetical protein
VPRIFVQAAIFATVLAVFALFLLLTGSGEGLEEATWFYLTFYLVLLPFAGLISLWWKFWGSKPRPLQPGTGSPADTGASEQIEPNMGAIGLALAAAGLAIVSVFLPRLESDTFREIAENTLIQSGEGWIILGCAVGVFGAVYRIYSENSTNWAVFGLGIVILAFAIYAGTGDRVELESVSGGLYSGSITDTGTPAVGIYAAGAAGVMAMMAGWVLAGHSMSSFETSTDRRTKNCPECAETVLAAARVCKHCGHRFAPPTADQPQ